MSESLRPPGLQSTRLLYPWNSSGKNTGVGSHFILQRIFPPQGSKRTSHENVTSWIGFSLYLYNNRLPRWHSDKESTYQCRRLRRHGFDPCLGKIPWRRKWQSTPVFCLENPRDRGAWWAAVYGVTQSRTRSKEKAIKRVKRQSREQEKKLWSEAISKMC